MSIVEKDYIKYFTLYYLIFSSHSSDMVDSHRLISPLIKIIGIDQNWKCAQMIIDERLTIFDDKQAIISFTQLKLSVVKSNQKRQILIIFDNNATNVVAYSNPTILFRLNSICRKIRRITQIIKLDNYSITFIGHCRISIDDLKSKNKIDVVPFRVMLMKLMSNISYRDDKTKSIVRFMKR